MPRNKTWILIEGKLLGMNLLIPWIDDDDKRLSLNRQIKGVQGRVWDPKLKRWFFPMHQCLAAASVLDDFYPELAEAVRVHISLAEWDQLMRDRWDLSGAKSLRDVEGDWGNFEMKLRNVMGRKLYRLMYDFQKVGVLFLDLCHGRGLLADDMGLGKTLQAIAYWHYEPTKTVVICPAGLKLNWAKEIGKWAPGAKLTIVARLPKKLTQQYEAASIILPGDPIPETDILITSYKSIRQIDDDDEKLTPLGEQILEQRFGSIIIDECQNIKNSKTKQSKGIRKIAAACRKVIALSGTPIRNRPSEFFTILNMISPKEFPSWRAFALEFCDGHYDVITLRGGEQKQIFKADGMSNWQQLNWKLKNLMLRREKKNVLKDLPEKTRQVVEIILPADRMKNYALRVKDTTQWFDLGSLSELRMWVGREKLPFIQSAIDEQIAAGNTVVVFFHHRRVEEKLSDYCQRQGYKFQSIDGDTDMSWRQTIVEKFQKGHYQLLLASTLTMGTGFNLTAANIAMFVEPEWSPADILQAEDRLLRIGQKNAVHVLHYSAVNTIDELFYDQLEEKMESLGKILDENSKVESFEKVAYNYLRHYND